MTVHVGHRHGDRMVRLDVEWRMGPVRFHLKSFVKASMARAMAESLVRHAEAVEHGR